MLQISKGLGSSVEPVCMYIAHTLIISTNSVHTCDKSPAGAESTILLDNASAAQIPTNKKSQTRIKTH